MADKVELIFGLVGPIGCKVHEARDALEASLKKVNYKPVSISISQEMDNLLKLRGKNFKPKKTSQLENKIRKGNFVRKHFEDNGILAAEAMRQIIFSRRELLLKGGETSPKKLVKKPFFHWTVMLSLSINSRGLKKLSCLSMRLANDSSRFR